MCTLIKSPHGFIVRRWPHKSSTDSHHGLRPSTTPGRQACLNLFSDQSFVSTDCQHPRAALLGKGHSVQAINLYTLFWWTPPSHLLFWWPKRQIGVGPKLWIDIDFKFKVIIRRVDPEISCDNRSVTRAGGKQADNEELGSLGMLTAWMVLCSVFLHGSNTLFMALLYQFNPSVECPNWIYLLLYKQISASACVDARTET